VTLDQVGLFVDGVAVRQIGKETFRSRATAWTNGAGLDRRDLCRDQGHLRRHRSVAEPAVPRVQAEEVREGEGHPDASLVAIDSGANINFDRLRHVASGPRSASGARPCSPFRSRSAGQLPAVLQGARPAQHHRVQLPIRGRGRGHVFCGVELSAATRSATSWCALREKGYE